MASTLCLWPIVVALLCADGISKNEKTLWEVSDNAGQHFLANTYKSIADTIQNASLPTDSLPPSFADKVDNFIQNNFHKDASHKEVVVKASQDVAVVNEFMKNNGFPGLQLTPSEDLFSWYIAALLDIKETWAIPGSEDYIHYNNARYQAARFTSSKSQAFDVYEVPNSASSKPITVLSMKTENGDKVFMTLADKPRAGFDLLTHVQQLTPSANAHKTHYDEVYFPYVELDHRCDPAWLIGAFKAKSVEGEEVRIMQALQQTRFSMNELGAEVKSMFAMGLLCTSALRLDPPKRLYLDKPFYLWIIRPSLAGNLPILAAYCDKTVWKREPERRPAPCDDLRIPLMPS